MLALKTVTNSFGIPGTRLYRSLAPGMSQPTSEEITERRVQLRLYMGLIIVTAARWDIMGQKEKDEFLFKVEKYAAHKAGDKESQVWASSNPVDKLELELKTAISIYATAKEQQQSQAKRAAAEAAQQEGTPVMSAEASTPAQRKNFSGRKDVYQNFATKGSCGYGSTKISLLRAARRGVQAKRGRCRGSRATTKSSEKRGHQASAEESLQIRSSMHYQGCSR
jgi:hypothetical protein